MVSPSAVGKQCIRAQQVYLSWENKPADLNVCQQAAWYGWLNLAALGCCDNQCYWPIATSLVFLSATIPISKRLAKAGFIKQHWFFIFKLVLLLSVALLHETCHREARPAGGPWFHLQDWLHMLLRRLTSEWGMPSVVLEWCWFSLGEATVCLLNTHYWWNKAQTRRDHVSGTGPWP